MLTAFLIKENLDEDYLNQIKQILQVAQFAINGFTLNHY